MVVTLVRTGSYLLIVCMLLMIAACSNQTNAVSMQRTPVPSRQATPTSAQVVPIVQQHLPKGLLKAGYPVMDWVFNTTCGRAVDSYNSVQMNTAIAYDSSAWLYPSDGHLVEGWQNCDNAALMRQARNQGLPTLLTVGVDSHWSDQELAQYIDQAASQAQVPCTEQATTFICAIVNWAVTGGYTGVIIDFESVNGNYPDIRKKFALFMQELQDALHQKGLLCGIALIHKISDGPAEDPSFHGNSFEDWKLLSKLDFLIVMVLDLDLSLNKPGPLVSIGWVEKQLDYLWQTIPQALSKTIFEFPLYGRGWQQDANGKWHPLDDETCQQVSDEKAAHPSPTEVSTDPTTPELAWKDESGNQHEVWYDTASSLITIMTHLQEKARGLLNDPHYKLPTSFWYRGAECAGFFGPGNALEAFYSR
jgi:spore germination protein YaaH